MSLRCTFMYAEPVFVYVYGAKESIPMNRLRQAENRFLGLQMRALYCIVRNSKLFVQGTCNNWQMLAYISVILLMSLIGSEHITSRDATVAQNTSEAAIGRAMQNMSEAYWWRRSAGSPSKHQSRLSAGPGISNRPEPKLLNV